MFSPTDTVHITSEVEMLTQNLDDKQQSITDQYEEYQRSLETDRGFENRKRAKISGRSQLSQETS